MLFTVGVVFTDVLVYWLALSPFFWEGWSITVNVAFAVANVVMLASGLFAMLVDPSKSARAPGREGEQVTWVYCHFCAADVRAGSKHCWDCNKCTLGFDHHCVWLNTCVATRNYLAFFTAAASVFVITSLLMGAALACLVAEHFDSLGDWWSEDVEPVSLSILCGGVLILNGPLWISVMILLAFHTYLCYTGMTTLAFLKSRAAKDTNFLTTVFRQALRCFQFFAGKAKRRGKSRVAATVTTAAPVVSDASGVAQAIAKETAENGAIVEGRAPAELKPPQVTPAAAPPVASPGAVVIAGAAAAPVAAAAERTPPQVATGVPGASRPESAQGDGPPQGQT